MSKEKIHMPGVRGMQHEIEIFGEHLHDVTRITIGGQIYRPESRLRAWLRRSFARLARRFAP